MGSKITKILIVTLFLSFGVALTAFGAVPPPPVNQNLGLVDTMFNNLLEADCRFCHSTSPPPGIPVDPSYLPNRHHLNVGTAVPVGLCADTTNSCNTDQDCNVCTDNTTPCSTDADCPVGETCTTGENYCVGESERPYPAGDTAGNYDCYSCHALLWDGSAFVLEVFRDCNFCHKAEFQPDHPDRAQELNQHHRVAEARAGECSYCHGALVQDGVADTDGDGFADKRACDGVVSIPGQCDWIPTYQPSLVTPWPSEKNFGRCDETCDNIDPVTLIGACSVSGIECTSDADCGGSDTQCVTDADCPISGETCNLDLDGGGGGMANARGHEQGNCNYCHDSSTTDVCDEVTGLCAISGTPCLADYDCNGPILINHDTHHFTGATGLVPAGASCGLCHPTRTPTRTAADMRGCERCHGFPSLHNIQVDSNGDGMIMPNGENPYFGHIGSNTDCNGCHGFSVAAAPGTGAVIPFIDSADDLTVTAGTDTTVALTGVAFTNVIDAGTELIELTSDVELTASDGSVTALTPDSVSESEIVVTIPGSMATGNYHLRAIKGSKDSNPVVVAITPAVTITDVNCDKKKGIITVTGTGFGDKPEGTDAYLNLQVNGQTVELISWADTQIKGSVGRCSGKAAVTVNALYGAATNGKPCKGKRCR